jgi:hypothetical protein
MLLKKEIQYPDKLNLSDLLSNDSVIESGCLLEFNTLNVNLKN